MAEVNVETAKNLGLTAEEFEKIIEIMGREPNFNELSIYSVMWSEHCSYKNSIKYLKTLPREGKKLLVAAGEENAGLVDIGDGLACAFKIESHNHPSALEPYQGCGCSVRDSAFAQGVGDLWQGEGEVLALVGIGFLCCCL